MAEGSMPWGLEVRGTSSFPDDLFCVSHRDLSAYHGTFLFRASSASCAHFDCTYVLTTDPCQESKPKGPNIAKSKVHAFNIGKGALIKKS